MTHKCYVIHKGMIRTWAQTAYHTASSTEACLQTEARYARQLTSVKGSAMSSRSGMLS